MNPRYLDHEYEIERLTTGLTQAEFAEKAFKVERRTYARWLSGENSPSFEALHNYKNYLEKKEKTA